MDICASLWFMWFMAAMHSVKTYSTHCQMAEIIQLLKLVMTNLKVDQKQKGKNIKMFHTKSEPL